MSSAAAAYFHRLLHAIKIGDCKAAKHTGKECAHLVAQGSDPSEFLPLADQSDERLPQVAVMKLKPGDRVVLSVPNQLSPEAITRLNKEWRAFLPDGVQVVVLEQGTTLSVLSLDTGTADRLEKLEALASAVAQCRQNEEDCLEIIFSSSWEDVVEKHKGLDTAVRTA